MVIKIITIIMVCMAPALHTLAQAEPQPASSKKDTAQERLEKAIKELDQMIKDFNNGSADAPTVKVGDKKDGAVIYWVDGTGKHGLMVHPKDLGIMKWEEADQACKKLGAGWHMPTKDELDKLYKANTTLNILSSYFLFHSSTEESPGVVWKQSLSNGNVKTGYKTGTASTAAVRTF